MRNNYKNELDDHRNPIIYIREAVCWIFRRFHVPTSCRPLLLEDYSQNNLENKFSDFENSIFDIINSIICNFLVLPQRSPPNGDWDLGNFINWFSVFEIWVDNRFYVFCSSLTEELLYILPNENLVPVSFLLIYLEKWSTFCSSAKKF